MYIKRVKGKRFLEQITFFIEIIQSMVLMKTNDFLYNKLFTFSCSNIISRFKKKNHQITFTVISNIYLSYLRFFVRFRYGKRADPYASHNVSEHPINLLRMLLAIRQKQREQQAKREQLDNEDRSKLKIIHPYNDCAPRYYDLME